MASFFPFPTYANGNGPAAQFVVDTTALANGLHTMAWVAVDDQGVAQGIVGSRYFTVDNGAATQVTAGVADEARSAKAVSSLPQATALVWNRQGFDDRRWALQWAGGWANLIGAAARPLQRPPTIIQALAVPDERRCLRQRADRLGAARLVGDPGRDLRCRNCPVDREVAAAEIPCATPWSSTAIQAIVCTPLASRSYRGRTVPRAVSIGVRREGEEPGHIGAGEP